MLNFDEIEKFFPFCMKRCTTTKKTQESPCDPTKIAIYSLLRPEIEFISNCFHNFQKTASFDDIVHFIDEESIVTYVHFDCESTFYYEAPIKVRQTNGEQKNIFTSCKKTRVHPK